MSEEAEAEAEAEYNRKRYVRAIGDVMETFSDIMEEQKDG